MRSSRAGAAQLIRAEARRCGRGAENGNCYGNRNGNGDSKGNHNRHGNGDSKGNGKCRDAEKTENAEYR